MPAGKQSATDMVLLFHRECGPTDRRQASSAGLALNQGAVSWSQMKFLQEQVFPNIYAAGDVIEVEQLVSGERTMIPLAGPCQ